MPSCFAHEVYGDLVLARLPAPLRDRITRERTAYICGQYGPDPLYFLPGTARSAGRQLHRQAAGVPLGRLADAARAGRPQATGYLAGFLCHYLLDRACHPYILQQAARGPLNHPAIETEFDRWLLAQQGCRGRRGTPSVPALLPRAVCEAAAAACEALDAACFQRAYRSFVLFCRAFTRLQGTPVRPLLTGLSRVPGLGAVRGSISGRRPDPAAAPSNRRLLQLLTAAVEPGAACIAAFFDALDRGAAPGNDPSLRTDFFGRPVAIAADL